MDQAAKLKTIDEILDDLDKEKLQYNQYSREHLRQSKEFLDILIDEDLISDIIDKNHSKSTEELVILRKDYVGCCKKPQELPNDFRYSDDLNSLLEQLCKVTNAPILNTNATSSLVYHSETSDEWIKMIPLRKRTYSDPDYDVPRPHSSAKFASHQPISLQILPKESVDNELVEKTQQTTVGISPQTIKEINPSSIEEDRSVTSYTSHQYAKELPLPNFKTTSSKASQEDLINLKQSQLQTIISSDDYDSTDMELQQINKKLLNNNNNTTTTNNNNNKILFHPKYDKQEYETQQVCHVLVEDYTYASPRSFVSFDHMINECEHTIQLRTGNVSTACDDHQRQSDVDDEVFADSLEPFDLEQLSTEF